MGWTISKLKSICTKIVDGNHNPPSSLDYKTDYIMLSSQNIGDLGIINLDKVRYIKKEQFKMIKNNLSNSEKKLINLTNNIDSFISYLQTLIEQIRNEFKKYKEKNQLEIKIANDIIDMYEDMKEKNCLNYHLINNDN